MTDWTAEGLLEGLDTEKDRAARIELLDRLHAEGCDVDELRGAAADDRLALLPLDKIMRRDVRYTMDETAEKTGISREYLDADWRAMGMTGRPDHEPVHTDDGIVAFAALKAMLDAGVPEARLLELTRMVGDASQKLADATLRTFGDALLQPGDTENDLSLRIVDLTNALMPHLGHLLAVPMEMHIAEIARHESIGRVERQRGTVPGAGHVAICFADMVGFTRLSESLDIDDLAAVTQRFGDLAGETAAAPVRLVKTIGDEAMLASEDAAALVETSLALIDAAERDDLLPPLRAGAAAGQALRRAGDYYGRPVNLAARITSVAPPGGLVANDGLRDSAGDGFDWTAAGSRGFKGIEGEVELYQVSLAR